MSMMRAAVGASASAAFRRRVMSSAAEAPMNWRRDKVNRGDAGIVRDLRTGVCRGFADGSNMKCGPGTSRAHLTFGAAGHSRFCLAERGYDGSRGLEPTGSERKKRASRSDA